MVRLHLKNIPDTASDKALRFIGIRNGYIKSLLAMGWCPEKLCKVAVNHHTTTGGSLLMAHYPPDALSSLSPKILDYVRSNFKNAPSAAVARWEAASARDRSEFQAARRADTNSLSSTISAESALLDGDVTGMVNTIWSNGMQEGSETLNQRVLTCVALSARRNPVTDVDESIKLLLQRGASVVQSSPIANSSLIDVLTNARKGHVHIDRRRCEIDCLMIQPSTLGLLLEAAASRDFDRECGSDSVLRIVCKALMKSYGAPCEQGVPHCITTIDTLLRMGCDPGSTNGDGMIPREVLLIPKKLSFGYGKVVGTLDVAVNLLRAWEKKKSGGLTKDADQEPGRIYER